MVEQKITAEYAPAFSVIAEGQDITHTLQTCLAELTLTDYGGATAKADELKITLLSETLVLPSKGARLRLGLGFNENLADKGWFVVSGVGSSGPPRRIDIYATAAPMNAQKQPGDVLSQKNRSWDNLRVADLVKTVATENGLIPRVASTLADIRIDHLDQVAESDASLLTRLARGCNAVSKCSGGYWLFLEQGASETVSGAPARQVTLLPQEVSRWSYREGERGSTTGKSAGKKKTGKIGVRYYDEADGKTKLTTVDHAGPALISPYTRESRAVARQQAKSRKTRAKRDGKKMTVTGPCRPKHLPLTAECRVTTSGFGSREDRTWLVESLMYTLTATGFIYTLNLVTDIRKKGNKKAKKPDKQGPDYFG